MLIITSFGLMVLLGVCEGRVRNLASPFLWFSYCVSHNNLASGIIRWRKTWGLLLTGGGAVPALLSAYIKARLCLTGPIIVAGSMQHTLTLACPWKFPKLPVFTGSWYNPKRQQMTVFNTYLTISPASGWGGQCSSRQPWLFLSTLRSVLRQPTSKHSQFWLLWGKIKN